MKLILASKSGVRKQILDKHNIDNEVVISNVTGISFVPLTVIVTVEVLLSTVPSFAFQVKISEPL